MSRRGLVHWLVLLGLLGALAAVTWLRVWVDDGQSGTGEAARPSFSLPDLSGRQRSIAEWDGQVVVLNFWATWCPPCVEEMPELAEVEEKYAERGLQVVGVAMDDRESIETFLAKVPVNYPVLYSVTEVPGLLEAYGNPRATLPYTVIIDRDGFIRKTLPRATDAEELARLTRPFL